MVWTSGSLIVLLLVILLLQFLKLYWISRRLPPGPKPMPVIGNLWTLNFTFHHDRLIELAKVYGSIFTLWMGQTPVIVLNGYTAVKEALVTNYDTFSGRPATPYIKKYASEKGVIVSNGNTWKQQRRFSLLTLRNLGLGKKSLENQIKDEALHLVNVFASHEGHPLNPTTALSHSIYTVTAGMVFGHHFLTEDKVFQKLNEAIVAVINFNGTPWGRLYDAIPSLMNHLPGPHQKVFEHLQFLRSHIEQEIRNHRENLSVEPQDFMDYYLVQMSKAKGDPTSTFDDNNMMQVVTDFFVAGTETMITTLRWALLYMVAFPEVQEKVQQELDAVIGSLQKIQYEDYQKLPYTNAVIHEVQRYSNIVSVGLVRQCVRSANIQGFHIEKGAIILPNLTSVLHDPTHWETPKMFNPGHFLDKEGNFIKKDAFIPFSIGHRACAGKHLAKMELFIFFTSILQAFTLRLPKGVKEASFDYTFGTTLQLLPYQICAHPR
ncbi:cytochrome P450 2J5-like [Pleurodeles waltl]|uniref:cytochrome P450 2J5-like n=1 Tax=Pleurodeles waltl TaxID=8319 RepID=UPI0037093915